MHKFAHIRTYLVHLWYGYYPKASKYWLVVKEVVAEEAKRLFNGTGIQITTDGRRLLGAAVGTKEFDK